MREVSIERANGRLFLAGMPGRYKPFPEDVQEILGQRIDTVIALASLDETRHKSPDYAEAIETGALLFSRREFAIPDFGVPADRQAYLEMVKAAAGELRAGKIILIHCGAGIGRTGTLAASILTTLGYSPADALGRVSAAGSGPETDEQRALVDWAASAIHKHRD